MPDIFRVPTRMLCAGLDLAHPYDRMPEGSFPYLVNVRVLQEGRLESRPGYQALSFPLSPQLLHSIRRLNDTIDGAYIDVIGDGTVILAGAVSTSPTSLVQVDIGYSGLPLSLIPFRPNNSPVAWMYIYDAAKQSKINPQLVVRPIGIKPPAAPVLQYGQPSFAFIDEASTATDWVLYGMGSSLAEVNRLTGTIVNRGFNSPSPGTYPGWLLINPSGTQPNAGARMRVDFNGEIATVRDVIPAVPDTTVLGILYDSGNTGPCSIILKETPSFLARNACIRIGVSELIYVQSVTQASDSSVASFRAITSGSYNAGDAISGLDVWFTFVVGAHDPGESFNAFSLQYSGSGAGIAAIAKLTSLDLSTTTSSLTLDTANDYMHISLWLDNPTTVTQVLLQIDVDSGTTTVGGSGDAFTRNYYTWTVVPAQITGQWTELNLPISAAVRTGADPSRNFSTVKAIQIQVTSGAACGGGFSGWYFFGSYGPVIQPNAPVGYQYLSVDRDSTTGAVSAPGPAARYEMFPLREQVVVLPATTAQVGVDVLDIYKQGGSLPGFVFDGTVFNQPATPQSFADNASDASLAAGPAPNIVALQPWPVVKPAFSGTVNVVGTNVQWISGGQFDTNLLPGTVIEINGSDYQVYGQPHSATFLELTSSAGVQFNTPFIVPDPVLVAQPLPFAFGPLEGPFAPVIFALGDPYNAGTLYFSNLSDADSASDANTIELCSPSEPLISGDVWNGLCICGSRDNLFLVRYSYLTTLGVSNSTTYQFNRQQAPSGIWSRWACKRGPDGIYFLGRDGIYKATDQGAENISDAQLYPLFPHDGQTASAVNVNQLYSVAPVDMTRLTDLRINCADQDVYFDYVDINGIQSCLRYEIPKKRWFLHSYADPIVMHYLVEAAVSIPQIPELVLVSRNTGLLYSSGGNTDNGTAITSVVALPSLDGGDERAQKLYVDSMLDIDGTGSVSQTLAYNDVTVIGNTFTSTVSGFRSQFLSVLNTIAGGLNLYRNVSTYLTWQGGPGGPRIYAWEPSGYVQPYLSTNMVTQYIPLGAPGWKMHRRLYPAMISLTPVLFTVRTQDGRTYGPYVLPSTGGQYRQIAQMLDQTIKDLAFAYQIDGQGSTFAVFPNEFTIEVKNWTSPEFALIPVLRT